MLKIVLSSLFALHGVIHLMGFAKERKLRSDLKVSGKRSPGPSKAIGLLWVLACVMLLTGAYGYYLSKDWFSIAGAVGLILSQGLIARYWSEAKWGTAVNVVLLFAVAFAAGQTMFERMVNKEINTLISESSQKQSIVTEEKVARLPNVIQTWLRRSRVIGQPVPKTIHIVQKGSMRTDSDSPWMPFDAEQWFTINPPGFVWRATIHHRYITIAGRDKYENGRGNMMIKAESFIPVANSSGKEVDQGTLIRFMAEIIWFPHAAISEYLQWEEIDPSHAKITMTYGGITATGVYSFDNDGLPMGFEAQRYGAFDGKFSKETWSVKTTGYGTFEGLPIGNTSEVSWKFNDGDFKWLKLVIADIRYN